MKFRKISSTLPESGGKRNRKNVEAIHQKPTVSTIRSSMAALRFVGDGNRRVPCAQCEHDHHLSVVYPNMKDIKRVTLAKRSGVIAFGV